MIKRQWVIGCCLAFWAIVFLLIAILTPIILSNLLEENIKDGVALTKSNKVAVWGKIPGDFKAKMYQSFNFFTILNPEGVIQGEQPQLEKKTGYIYQEYDKFEDTEWHTVDDHKLVRFHLLRYTKITDNTKWKKGVTPDDQIMQVSLGAFGAWFQLKHLTRQQIAISALFEIVNGLETSLVTTAYGQAILPLLGGYRAAQALIFNPAGINVTRGEGIWDDQYYGMGGNTTISIWVQALMENLVNDTFVITHPISGTLYILWSYLGISETELISIFSGHFKDAYDLTTLLFYNNYECPDDANYTLTCDPLYLANLQWTYSGVTLYPPFMAGPAISIAMSNDTTPGYPEMYYFYNDTTTVNKYGEYSFTMEDYSSLFYYNRKNNFPEYSKYTLLDVGKINSFFTEAYKENFGEIQNMLNLSTEAKARVLWDYINALIDFTALQGRYDPTVYNIDNRGMTQELSLGTVGSQTLYSVLVNMSDTLPIVISSMYNFYRSYSQGISCQGLVLEILSPQNASICSIYGLDWGLSSNGISLWILTYWNDINSTYWDDFKKLSELTQNEMVKLFKTSNQLTSIFSQYDLELKDNYNCTNVGPRCDPMFLAKMQWGMGLVTENLPTILENYQVKNSSTIVNYQYMSMGLTGTPEYYSYGISKGIKSVLSVEQINYLLSFEGILNSVVLQKFFLYEYELNFEGQAKLLKIADTELMIDYLRYMIDLYFLGGLIKSKSVNQILWADYNEPLLIQSKSLSPLLGGNPATNLNSTSVGQNMTQDQFKHIDKKFKDGMDTGQKNAKNVRVYRLYGGVEYMNQLQQAYLGESDKGPVIEYVNYNPWPEEIEIQGTDAWGFEPYLTKHSDLIFFLDVASYYFKGEYDKKVTKKNFECLRFVINADNLKNATENKANAKFMAFGPNGLVNQTGVFTAPLFGSKPYFYGADKTLLKLINYSDPSQVEPEKYESVFDIERYTGTVLHANEQIQYNVELKPDMLYPKLGAYNLNKYGYNTYMPMFFLQRYETLSQHICDKFFGIVHVIFTVILVAQIVGYVLAGILIILLGVYIWKRHRQARIYSESEKGQSLIIK